MAEELRLALILLGALAIGSVILHGIWTVRRTVNDERKAAKKEAELEEPEVAPEEQEAQKLKLKQMEMDFATLSESKTEGEGIPVARVDVDSIYAETQVDEPPIEQVADTTEEVDQQAMFIHDDLELDEDMPQISTQDIDEDSHQVQINTEQLDEAELADTPVITKDLTVNDDELTVSNDLNTSSAESQPTQPPEKQEVLMLFVDKSEGMPIDGAKLLPTLLTLGFKFGDMDLFHRHEHSSGQGEVLFSLANMFNPGTFDIDRMEQLTTRGLTIFMTLPNAAEPLQTFNMMHNAAKKIADEFEASVLDDKRRPLDVAIVRAYVERIRKF